MERCLFYDNAGMIIIALFSIMFEQGMSQEYHIYNEGNET